MVDSTRGEILPGPFGPGIFEQVVVIEIRGEFQRIVDLECLLILVIPVSRTLNDNSRLARQDLHSLGETDSLVFLYEGEDVAAGLTTKAVVGLPCGVDVEGRGLLVVEGAQSLPALARLLEFDGATDQAQDIGSVAYRLYRFFRDETQGRLRDPSLLKFRGPSV